MSGNQTWLYLSITIAAAGCISVPTRPEINPSVISRAEIEGSGATTAYDVIKKMRPLFLSYRGETTLLAPVSPYPKVWIDGIEFGRLESLRTIPAFEISEIRLYRGFVPAAFGAGNTSGVIAIVTRH